MFGTNSQELMEKKAIDTLNEGRDKVKNEIKRGSHLQGRKICKGCRKFYLSSQLESGLCPSCQKSPKSKINSDEHRKCIFCGEETFYIIDNRTFECVNCGSIYKAIS